MVLTKLISQKGDLLWQGEIDPVLVPQIDETIIAESIGCAKSYLVENSIKCFRNGTVEVSVYLTDVVKNES